MKQKINDILCKYCNPRQDDNVTIEDLLFTIIKAGLIVIAGCAVVVIIIVGIYDIYQSILNPKYFDISYSETLFSITTLRTTPAVLVSLCVATIVFVIVGVIVARLIEIINTLLGVKIAHCKLKKE